MRWVDEPMPTRRFPFSVDKPDGGEIRVTVSYVHWKGQSRARWVIDTAPRRTT